MMVMKLSKLRPFMCQEMERTFSRSRIAQGKFEVQNSSIGLKYNSLYSRIGLKYNS